MTGRAGRGVVLAGGRATRLPGKLCADLGGRPLLAWPVEAMRSAGLEVLVAGKETDGDLRELAGRLGARWLPEPASPVHPLLGIVTALRETGSSVVVCAGDMPHVGAALLARLARGDGADVLACEHGGFLQPLIARYSPAVLPALERAVAAEESAIATLEGLGGRLAVLTGERLSEFGDPALMMADVDTAAALAEARLRASTKVVCGLRTP